MEPIPPHFTAAANMAHEAAIAIFEMILNDGKLQESLVGMPHYFHIMIAFAGHFLLDVCAKFYEQLMIDLDSDFHLVGRVLVLLNNIPSVPQHPINRMTTGLIRKLVDSAASMGKGSTLNGSLYQHATNTFDHNLMNAGVHNQILDQPRTATATPLDFAFGQVPVPPDDFVFADFGGFNFTY